MKFSRTPLALAAAGVLLAGGANAALLVCDEDPRFAAEANCAVEPVAVSEATAGFEWVLGPELVSYYLPASQSSQIAMANPTVPSESDSWGE